MLYWGSKGLERDVVAALEYYRLAAETGEPSALYDYGIVLLKVSISIFDKFHRQRHHHRHHHQNIPLYGYFQND